MCVGKQKILTVKRFGGFSNRRVNIGSVNRKFGYTSHPYFKHFLKAENSEDSLAISCEEFCIGFHVTQYEMGYYWNYE